MAEQKLYAVRLPNGKWLGEDLGGPEVWMTKQAAIDHAADARRLKLIDGKARVVPVRLVEATDEPLHA